MFEGGLLEGVSDRGRVCGVWGLRFVAFFCGMIDSSFICFLLRNGYLFGGM